MIDLDSYHYTIKDNKRVPVALIDWKHNGLSGPTQYHNHVINLDQESIKALYDLSKTLRIPLFIIITYTKPEEQPNPMFYVIPRNNPAQKALTKLTNSHKPAWMTPYHFAQLMFQLRDQSFPATGEATELSNVLAYYPLPHITKATYGY